MEGVLPPEIQWRNDKQPYSPDYITRILKEKEAINTLMHTVEDGPVMKFINPSHVADALNSLQPTTGMADGKEIAGIRISQGVIATSFLNWLLQNGYLFK
jgi:asparagine synthase (glutamine-hydrolysing)